MEMRQRAAGGTRGKQRAVRRAVPAILPPMPRYMAIDFGTKRIGLAVGDNLLRLASPLTTLSATGRWNQDVAAVTREADEYGVDEFVVGLPLNMDDTEGPQAKLTRRFGETLARHCGKPVHYYDERLSSAAADDRLQPAGLTNKKHKSKRDRVAAQIILQDFLDALA